SSATAQDNSKNSPGSSQTRLLNCDSRCCLSEPPSLASLASPPHEGESRRSGRGSLKQYALEAGLESTVTLDWPLRRESPGGPRGDRNGNGASSKPSFSDSLDRCVDKGCMAVPWIYRLISRQ